MSDDVARQIEETRRQIEETRRQIEETRRQEWGLSESEKMIIEMLNRKE